MFDSSYDFKSYHKFISLLQN